MMQLQVHLEGEQYITFDMNAAQQLCEQKDTHLTAFFKANKWYPEACTILYPDFPSKFIATGDGILKKEEKHAVRWYSFLQMLGKSFTHASFFPMQQICVALLISKPSME